MALNDPDPKNSPNNKRIALPDKKVNNAVSKIPISFANRPFVADLREQSYDNDLPAQSYYQTNIDAKSTYSLITVQPRLKSS